MSTITDTNGEKMQSRNQASFLDTVDSQKRKGFQLPTSQSFIRSGVDFWIYENRTGKYNPLQLSLIGEGRIACCGSVRIDGMPCYQSVVHEVFDGNKWVKFTYDHIEIQKQFREKWGSKMRNTEMHYCYHNKTYIKSGAAHGVYCDPIKNDRGKCVVSKDKQLVKFGDGTIQAVMRRALRLTSKCKYHQAIKDELSFFQKFNR
ncbi:MAG: hypothetical protein GY928_33750 [Colwellia sp.]|nr:hypothetical protein [Colwellia sp.]